MKTAFFRSVLACLMVMNFLTPAPLVSAEAVLPPGTFVLDEIPPKAQQVFNLGLEAAQNENWELAMRYFEELQDDYILYPPLMFNIALSKANTGGDLEAMAWLNAYLEIVPNAPNAEAIRAEIIRLHKTAEDRVRAVFENLRIICRSVNPDVAGYDYERSGAFQNLTNGMAAAGYVDEALEAQQAYFDQYSTFKETAKRETFLIHSAVLAAEVDDIEKAREALSDEAVQKEYSVSGVYKAIVESQLRSGDYEGAWKTYRDGKLDDPTLIREIMKPDIEAQNWIPVEVALEGIKDEAYRWDLVRILIPVFVREGDLVKAKRIADNFSDLSWRGGVYTMIAEELWRQGKVKEGKEIGEEWVGKLREYKGTREPGYQQDFVDTDIAKALAVAGRFSEAKKLSLVMGQNDFQPNQHANTFALIARLQFYQGDVKGAQRTAKEAEKRKDGYGQFYTPHLDIANLLFERGDVQDALKMARTINLKGEATADPFQKSFFLKVAERFLDEGNWKEAVKLMEGVEPKDVSYYGDEYKVFLKLARVYLNEGQPDKAFEIYDSFLAHFEEMMVTIRPKELMRSYVEVVRLKFQPAVDAGQISAEAVDWVIFGKILRRCGDFSGEVKRAGVQGGSSDTPSMLASRVSRAGQMLKRFLIRLKQMENGRPLDSVAHMVAQ